MEFPIVLLLVTIGGSTAASGIFNHCDVAHCNSLSFEFMMDFPPSKEQLENQCPSMLEMADCYSTGIPECTGKTLEELAVSDNTSVAEFASVLNNINNIFKALCNEDTELSKSYRPSANCIRESIKESARECRQEGAKLYEAYKLSLSTLENEAEESIKERTSELRCMPVGYEIACSIKEVEKICGKEAKEALLQIVRKLEVMKLGICTESELLMLRGQFLDFLEEQGKQRDILSAAFEFRKRRK